MQNLLRAEIVKHDGTVRSHGVPTYFTAPAALSKSVQEHTIKPYTR